MFEAKNKFKRYALSEFELGSQGVNPELNH